MKRSRDWHLWLSGTAGSERASFKATYLLESLPYYLHPAQVTCLIAWAIYQSEQGNTLVWTVVTAKSVWIGISGETEPHKPTDQNPEEENCDTRGSNTSNLGKKPLIQKYRGILLLDSFLFSFSALMGGLEIFLFNFFLLIFSFFPFLACSFVTFM